MESMEASGHGACWGLGWVCCQHHVSSFKMTIYLCTVCMLHTIGQDDMSVLASNTAKFVGDAVFLLPSLDSWDERCEGTVVLKSIFNMERDFLNTS